MNLSIQYNIGCEFCDNLFDCKSISCNNSEEQLPLWKKPDDSLISKINSEMLTKYAESQNTVEANLERSLEFFKLNSTFDIFDDSEDSYDENPAIFNQSMGVFNTYQSTQNHFKTVPITPTKTEISQDVISDSDTSPIFSRTGKIANLKLSQRQLFSQTRKICNQCTSEEINDSSTKLFKFSSVPNKPVSSVPNKPVSSVPNKPVASVPKKPVPSVPKKPVPSVPKKSIPSVPKKPVQKKNPILDLFSKSSTSESTATPIKGLKNILREQLANSTPIYPKKIDKEITATKGHDFWDESLFEISDSDEISEEENHKKTTSNICEEQCKESSDSDATIILSFHSEKEVNATNNSLLTITEVIDFLNETKTKNASKSLDTIENLSASDENVNNNQIIESVIAKKVEDCDPSDDESSLLSFSEKFRKKKQLQKTDQQAEVICISDDNNDLDLGNSLKENENVTNVTNILNTKNQNYKEEEPGLSNFSQRVEKVRNKKMKLQLQTTITKPETLSQDSPIKAVRRTGGFKRPSVISDSDDDFETKPRKKLTPESKRIKSVSETRSKLSLNYSKVPITIVRRKQKNPGQKKVFY